MDVLKIDAEKLVALIDLVVRCSGLELHAEVNSFGLPPDSDRHEVLVEFTGPDTPLLVANHGELLNAIESLGADVLGLYGSERWKVAFDTGHFRTHRERSLRGMAEAAILEVRSSATPHVFPAQSPRERHLLHDMIAPSGLRSESVGNEPSRHVVIYPEETFTSIEPPSLPSVQMR